MNRELALIYQQIIAPWVAAGPGGVTITPFTFHGAPAASPTGAAYNVNIGYLIGHIMFSSGNASASLAQGLVSLFDINNVAIGNIQNQSVAYDGGGAALTHIANPIEWSNIFVGRITNAARITIMKASGYIITRV